MNTGDSSFFDPLAALVSTEVQRRAAQRVQDVFTGVLRLTVEGASEAASRTALSEVEERCHHWCLAASETEMEPQVVRRALLISGLDQWGLAYSQAFGLTAFPALSSLVGALRQRLDERGDACFQRFFLQMETEEAAAIDFKVELRRGVHLALWHAMAAAEHEDQAAIVVSALGSLMLALEQRLPTFGWRLVADALAHIQIGWMELEKASPWVEGQTRALFEALRHALPAERYQTILAHSGQAVVAWQRSRRVDVGAETAAGS